MPLPSSRSTRSNYSSNGENRRNTDNSIGSISTFVPLHSFQPFGQEFRNSQATRENFFGSNKKNSAT